jgi:hypothetical protein
MSHQNVGDNDLVCMFHRTRTTGLENPQDSILSDVATALVPITTAAWKTAQHFSYGARGFMRVPVSEANDLNFLLTSWLDSGLVISFIGVCCERR